MLRESLFSFLRREHSFELTDGLPNLRLVGGVVEQSATEKAPILFQDSYSEMAVLIASLSRAAEGRLESEAIYQVEFAPHNDTGGTLTRLLHCEVASVEAEIFRVLTK